MKSVLICDVIYYVSIKSFMFAYKTALTLEREIYGNINLYSQPMDTHICLQNKVCFLYFKMNDLSCIIVNQLKLNSGPNKTTNICFLYKSFPI